MFSNSTNGTSVVSESNMKLGQVLEIIFLVLLMFFIIFGNILVCLAFNTFRHQLKTITNYFLVNLACSDFLVGVFPLPFWISVRTGKRRIKLILDSFLCTLKVKINLSRMLSKLCRKIHLCLIKLFFVLKISNIIIKFIHFGHVHS